MAAHWERNKDIDEYYRNLEGALAQHDDWSTRYISKVRDELATRWQQEQDAAAAARQQLLLLSPEQQKRAARERQDREDKVRRLDVSEERRPLDLRSPARIHHPSP
mgnify:FL=1